MKKSYFRLIQYTQKYVTYCNRVNYSGVLRTIRIIPFKCLFIRILPSFFLKKRLCKFDKTFITTSFFKIFKREFLLGQ